LRKPSTASALAIRQIALEFRAFGREPQQAFAAVARAALLLDIALLDQVLQHTADRLLGYLQDRQEVTDGLTGMAPDEIEGAMMGAAELVMPELLVGFEGKVAIGIEHQLDALAQLFVAQEKGVGGGSGFHAILYSAGGLR
jgi:hypothetical protein